MVTSEAVNQHWRNNLYKWSIKRVD